MARPVSNQSIEDYLEAILVIHQQKGYCRSVDVANSLNYTKASVSVAVSNLSRQDYLHKLADGNLSLTEKGLAYAGSVLDRHRLLTRALVWLGVPEETAAADACKIEHDISDESFRCLRQWLETHAPEAR